MKFSTSLKMIGRSVALVISITCSITAWSQTGNNSTAKKLIDYLHAAPFKVILVNGNVASNREVTLQRTWVKGLCNFSLKNISKAPVSIREVVIFDLHHGLPDTTAIFGEAFQKLGLIGGTLGNPLDLGHYPDRSHYKIPEPENMRTAYGMLTLQLNGGQRVLFATTSCNKFISRFSFNASRLRISFDCENLQLAPGQSWKLEEFMAIHSTDREKLYDQLTAAISKHHPRLKHDPVPQGWCSWSCFGPGVTAKNVSDNTDWIAKNLPALKYIQIDDGYQPWMGDWLDAGSAFGGDVSTVLKQIQSKNLEPAIWVAPFIASPQSKLFKDHPDWMAQDESGQPLRSDKIGFGGWRLGPWYVLDGTHPGVQQYLTELFHTMRQKWGCTYFKLDANYWGAIHGGVHYDKTATRIEAYRRGMQAILKGAGDAFLLGCNHPIWASMGLIHGSRSSMDIDRNWDSFRRIGKENLLRGWQNGRLWWNDPDCILLTDEGADVAFQDGNNPTDKIKIQQLSEDEFRFHAATIFATGGLLLSGDDLTKITPARLAILKKLIPATGVAARFENENFEVGVTDMKGYKVFSVFNWGETSVDRRIPLSGGKFRLTDKLSGEDLGIHEKQFIIRDLPKSSARMIEARRILTK